MSYDTLMRTVASAWQTWLWFGLALLYGLLAVQISYARIADNITRFWGADYLKIASIRVLWRAYYGKASLLFTLMMIGLYVSAGCIWAVNWPSMLRLGMAFLAAVLLLIGLIVLRKRDLRDGQLVYKPELVGFAALNVILLMVTVLA